MTLICAVPFKDGMLVASDRAGVRRDNVLKLHLAGGLLFSASHHAEQIDRRSGRVVFSVAELLIRSAPEKLEPADLAELADRAVADARWPRAGDNDDQAALVVFWFPRSFASFELHNKAGVVSRSNVGTVQIDPNRHVLPQLQGMSEYANRHVINGGRLSAASFALIQSRKPIRDITVKEATDLACDIQRATERALQTIPGPAPVGGGIDLFVVGLDGSVN